MVVAFEDNWLKQPMLCTNEEW